MGISKRSCTQFWLKSRYQFSQGRLIPIFYYLFMFSKQRIDPEDIFGSVVKMLWWRENFTRVFLERERDKHKIAMDREIIKQFLYLISRGDWYYKVWVSIDPEARLWQLQVWSNVRLKLEKIYEYDNAFLVEQFILSKFTDKVWEWIYLWSNGKKRIAELLSIYINQ